MVKVQVNICINGTCSDWVQRKQMFGLAILASSNYDFNFHTAQKPFSLLLPLQKISLTALLKIEFAHGANDQQKPLSWAIGHDFLCTLSLTDIYCCFTDCSRQAWFPLGALHLACWLLQFQDVPQYAESRDEVYLYLQDSRRRVWTSGAYDFESSSSP